MKSKDASMWCKCSMSKQESPAVARELATASLDIKVFRKMGLRFKKKN